jgi:feruloyl esterase
MGPTLLGAMLAAAGFAATAHAAPTASPCAALNASGPTAPTAEALSVALGFTGPGTGTPLVLAIQAQDVPANALAASEPSPALCEVGVVIASNGNPAQSQITVAVLLPEGSLGTNSTSAWNGRFLGTGNGGFAGSVATSTLGLGIIPAYAATGTTYVVANTDLGTGRLFNCNTLFCGSKEGVAIDTAGHATNPSVPIETAGGLYGDEAALRDFGYGATHLMTVAAKALINTFYGKSANYSYFHGCSTGGQQALMEAQKYPADYDGILAGSPAYDRTHLHVAGAAFFEVTHHAADGSAYLTNEALGLAHAGVLASCAGTDGGLSTDNFLNQPAKCTFDATVLQCTGATTDVPCTDPNGTSCTCLTPNQAISMNAAWSGAKDNAGRVLYPGYERGVEDPYAGVLAEEENVSEPLFDSLDYWAFGAAFNWQTLFANTDTVNGLLTRHLLALDRTPVGTTGDTFETVLNASSTDLSAFNANGGKLIMYAGYEDPLIPSASTIDYYNGLLRRDSTAPTYSRLYMAPGVWHCNGGPGANAFGNLSANQPVIPGAAFDDVLGALTAWREASLPPSSIIATKYVNDNSADGIAFQRPLCPYPKVAKYVHTSMDPTEAAAWACVAAHLVTNQSFAPPWGPQ